MDKKDNGIALFMDLSNSYAGGKLFMEIDINNSFVVLLLQQTGGVCDGCVSNRAYALRLQEQL